MHGGQGRPPRGTNTLEVGEYYLTLGTCIGPPDITSGECNSSPVVYKFLRKYHLLYYTSMSIVYLVAPNNTPPLQVFKERKLNQSRPEQASNLVVSGFSVCNPNETFHI